MSSKYLVVMPWTDLCAVESAFGARVAVFWATASDTREIFDAIDGLIADRPLALLEALGRDTEELRDENDPLEEEGIRFGESQLITLATVPDGVPEFPGADLLSTVAAGCQCCEVVDVLIRPDGSASCSFTGETVNLLSAPLIRGRRPVLCSICLRDALAVSERHWRLDLKLLSDASDLRAELADEDRSPDLETGETIDLVRLYGELLAKATVAEPAPEPTDPF